MACVSTHHHHTTNCTTLQPSISTHTHKNTKTIHYMHSALLCLLALTVLLYVSCFSFFYLDWYCMFIVCLYVHTYIVVFGILMEFVLYATIIAGTKTPAQCFSLCRHEMTTTFSSSFVLNSSIVFYLRQRIASGWILLLLLAILYCCWQLGGFCDQIDTEKRTKQP